MARRIGNKQEQPILPWRLVVGVLLHFAVPLYLLALLAAFLFLPNVPTGTEARVRWLLHMSALFVLGFIAATVAAGIVTALIDPLLRGLRRRRLARDPERSAIVSREGAEAACARIAAADWGEADTRVAAAAERLRRGPWYHSDPAGQRLSMDLTEAADAFLPALAGARGAKRAELASLAADAIERIADALDRQAAEKSRLDEGDARTIARLIDLRYGDNGRPVSLEGGSERE